ncbi:hypothetical protein M0804_011276 [Polistes exclamans]|nr:hypothetical protein M0804_011276 [Polistes exclamans]
MFLHISGLKPQPLCMAVRQQGKKGDCGNSSISISSSSNTDEDEDDDDDDDDDDDEHDAAGNTRLPWTHALGSFVAWCNVQLVGQLWKKKKKKKKKKKIRETRLSFTTRNLKKGGERNATNILILILVC